MPFLILSVFFTVLFFHTIRRAQARGCDMIVAGVVNYALASLICGLVSAAGGNREIHAVTLILGTLQGIGFIVSYILLCTSYERRGLAISTTITRLSMMIPILASVFWWGERPSPAQVIGIGASLGALPLLSAGSPFRPSGTKGIWFTMLLFLSVGGCHLVAKAFVMQQVPDAMTTYMAALFGVAAIGGGLSLPFRPFQPTRRDVKEGIFIGAANVLATLFTLIALDMVPGVIAFPVISCGGVLAMTLFAMVVWKERLTPRSRLGIGVALIGITLLNFK